MNEAPERKGMMPVSSPQPEHVMRHAGRAGGGRSVTAAEKAQAHEVSLRRIGRLFRPYRWSLALVIAIIALSSVVGLASPFLLRAIIDTALPAKDLHLLVWLVLGMVAVAAPDKVEEAIRLLGAAGDDVRQIGRIEEVDGEARTIMNFPAKWLRS